MKRVVNAFIEKKDYREALKSSLKKYVEAKDEAEKEKIKKEIKTIFEKILQTDKGFYDLIKENLSEREKTKAFFDRFVLVLFADILNHENNKEITEISKDLLHVNTFSNLLMSFFVNKTDKDKEIIATYYFHGLENLIGKKQVKFVEKDNVFFVEEKNVLRPIKTPIELLILISECSKRNVEKINVLYKPLAYKGDKQFISHFLSYYTSLINNMAIIKRESENIMAIYPKGFLMNDLIIFSRCLKFDVNSKSFILYDETKTESNEYCLFDNGISKELIKNISSSIIEKNRHDLSFLEKFLSTLSMPKHYSIVYEGMCKDLERAILDYVSTRFIKKFKKDMIFFSEEEKEIFLNNVIDYLSSLIKSTEIYNRRLYRYDKILRICYAHIKKIKNKEIKETLKKKIEDFYYKLIELMDERGSYNNIFSLINYFAKNKELSRDLYKEIKKRKDSAVINYFKICIERRVFNFWNEIFEDKRIKKETKEKVAKMVIDVCTKEGWYWTLKEISNNKHLSKKTRKEAAMNIEKAAINWIRKCERNDWAIQIKEVLKENYLTMHVKKIANEALKRIKNKKLGK